MVKVRRDTGVDDSCGTISRDALDAASSGGAATYHRNLLAGGPRPPCPKARWPPAATKGIGGSAKKQKVLTWNRRDTRLPAEDGPGLAPSSSAGTPRAPTHGTCRFDQQRQDTARAPPPEPAEDHWGPRQSPQGQNPAGPRRNGALRCVFGRTAPPLRPSPAVGL